MKPILKVFGACFRVSLMSTPVPIVAFVIFQKYALNDYALFVIMISLSVLSVSASVWFAGLTPEMKLLVKQLIGKVIRGRSKRLSQK